jgi:hypothetical protein
MRLAGASGKNRAHGPNIKTLTREGITQRNAVVTWQQGREGAGLREHRAKIHDRNARKAQGLRRDDDGGGGRCAQWLRRYNDGCRDGGIDINGCRGGGSSGCCLFYRSLFRCKLLGYPFPFLVVILAEKL